MTKYQQARANMVNCQISTYGVVSEPILEAFHSIKREMFLPENKRSIAYSGEELEVVPGRFLLEPAVQARMMEALEPTIDDVVLDVGGLCGYSSALFAQLCTTVIALENNDMLIAQSQSHWNDIDACNVVGLVGDLPSGSSKNMPYDIIFVNGACAQFPEQLALQLKEGGRMVYIEKAEGDVLGQVKLVRVGKDSQFSSLVLFEASASYLPGFAPGKVFVFE